MFGIRCGSHAKLALERLRIECLVSYVEAVEVIVIVNFLMLKYHFVCNLKISQQFTVLVPYQETLKESRVYFTHWLEFLQHGSEFKNIRYALDHL